MGPDTNAERDVISCVSNLMSAPSAAVSWPRVWKPTNNSRGRTRDVTEEQGGILFKIQRIICWKKGGVSYLTSSFPSLRIYPPGCNASYIFVHNLPCLISFSSKHHLRWALNHSEISRQLSNAFWHELSQRDKTKKSWARVSWTVLFYAR